MSADIITIHDIRKAFGGRPVLDGLDLSIREGSTFALLGPNGAGKTTLVRILSTLLRPDAGSATIAGFDLVRQPGEVRRAISLTGQYAAVDALLTAEENMRLMARLRHLDGAAAGRQVRDLMDRFELGTHTRRPVKTFSGGMKRKLDLAMSLIGSPRILFLDEPTTGLDPRSRSALWEMIRELAQAGSSIVLTTQYLEEADQLADRICLIDGGRVVADGTASDLKRRVGGEMIELTFRNPAALRRAMDRLPGSTLDAGAVRLGIDGSPHTVAQVLATLESAGVEADGLALHKPTLDDVFLAFTGPGAAAARTEAA
ncbi:MAG: ATP-binding cassette domain-containing protein [Thermomicrobiales bacterium]